MYSISRISQLLNKYLSVQQPTLYAWSFGLKCFSFKDWASFFISYKLRLI